MLLAATINIQPVTDQVINVAIGVATVVIGWVGWYVKNWVSNKVDLTKTTMDEQLQKMYNEAAARGMAYAATVVKDALPKTVEVQGVFVSTAVKYIINHWPELVAKVGLDEAKIGATILARLPSPEAAKADTIAAVNSGSVTVEVPAPSTKK